MEKADTNAPSTLNDNEQGPGLDLADPDTPDSADEAGEPDAPIAAPSAELSQIPPENTINQDNHGDLDAHAPPLAEEVPASQNEPISPYETELLSASLMCGTDSEFIVDVAGIPATGAYLEIDMKTLVAIDTASLWYSQPDAIWYVTENNGRHVHISLPLMQNGAYSLYGISARSINRAYITDAEGNVLIDTIPAQESISLMVGPSIGEAAYVTASDGYIPYDAWGTHEFYINGKLGVCVSPRLAAPYSGEYLIVDPGSLPAADNALYWWETIKRIMFYSVGGPGFDWALEHNVWPQTWYDGSPMSIEDYYVALHIMIAHLANDDLDGALFNCSEELTDWVVYHLFGFDIYDRVTVTNPNATFQLLSVNPNGAYGIPSGYDFDIFIVDGGYGYGNQFLMGMDWIYNPKGALELYKSSSQPELTNQNNAYSLEGAVFELLDSSGSVTATLTTDVYGYAVATDIPIGSYALVETCAPHGYAINTNTVDVTILDSQTTTIELTNAPQYNPLDIVVCKYDAVQTSRMLAGAQFTVSYYAGNYYDVSALPAKAERTWVVKTDSNGHAYFDASHKVSGDEYYTDAQGNTVIPLGTVIIEETLAPEGYEPSASIFLQNIEGDTSGNMTVNVFQYPSVPNTPKPKYGSLVLTKSASDPDTTHNNALYTLNDAIYGLYTAGTSMDSLDDPLLVLHTDESGVASAQGIPVGTYLLAEIQAPYGYALNTSCQEVEILADAVTEIDTGVMIDQIQYQPLSIVVYKTNADSGDPVEHAQFTLNYYAGGLYNTSNLPEQPTRSWVLESDSQGEVIFDALHKVSGDDFYFFESGSAAGIPLGTLTIQETKAPFGYIPDESLYLFQVDGSTSGEQKLNIFSAPAITNKLGYGGIDLWKQDADTCSGIPQGDATLTGAKYNVFDEAGNDILQITTGEDTHASTDLALKLGTYTIQETSAPQGYDLASYSQTVTLEYDGQVITLNEQAQPKDNVLRGGIELYKTSVGTGHTPQGDASLGNISFDIINVSKNPVYMNGTLYDIGDVVTTITTNEAGYAATACDLLPYGTYRVHESQSNNSMLAVTEDQLVEVRIANTLTTCEYEFENTPVCGYVYIIKTDADIQSNTSQGDASLDDAEFTIYNAGENSVLVNDVLIPVGEPAAVITSNKTSPKLPYGTYIVRETKAPTGYKPNTQEWTVQIREDGQTETLEISDEIIRGGISVQKVDLETHTAQALGAGNLSGITFEVRNGSIHPVIIDGVTYNTSEIVATLITNENGYAQTLVNLPYGTYNVTEIASNDTYLLYDTLTRTVSVREDGEVVCVSDTAGDFQNRICRGDFTFSKVNEDTMERLGMIPFKITSQTTGEYHIAVTDVNGMIDTANSWYAHSYHTNANDTILNQDGTINESSIDSAAGLWFYGYSNDEERSSEVNDALGALPYDTYLIEELPCSVNQDLHLSSFTVQISRDSVDLDLGTVDDKPIPSEPQNPTPPEEENPTISTILTSPKTHDHITLGEAVTTLEDTVTYTGLVAGKEYTLCGTLVDKATGNVLTQKNNAPITANLTFTPQESNGTVVLTFVFDASSLASHTLVAFETLSYQSEVIARHEDLDDSDQSVTIPRIATMFTNEENSHYVLGNYMANLVDTVSFEGLLPGRQYRMFGTLVYGDGSGPVKQNGSILEAVCDFVPDTPSGTVYVTFNNVDTSLLIGKSVVCFEALVLVSGYDGDEMVEVAVHDDIYDKAQTIAFDTPYLATTLSESESQSHEISAVGMMTLVDTVTYDGLIPGVSYTIAGMLYNKSTGRPLKVNGETVTSQAEFIPESPDGVIDITFTFDASSLQGISVVAFEKLLQNSLEIAAHEDINDMQQTVDFVAIHTTATNSNDESHFLECEKEAHLADRVELYNVIPGNTYILQTELIDLQTQGILATAQSSITPSYANTSYTIKTTLNTLELADHDLVFLESLLSEDGYVIAEHRDYNDKGQTLHVNPAPEVPPAEEPEKEPEPEEPTAPQEPTPPEITVIPTPPDTPHTTPNTYNPNYSMPQTGQGILWITLIGTGVALLIAVGMYYLLQSKKRSPQRTAAHFKTHNPASW
ncbi:MAG: VaFE repeat-containing surface-anchored protein [Coriobacteriales bacterium]|nr:VaFE repeat-containing surface-anchored protein [Coriobacteriales bacterium]